MNRHLRRERAAPRSFLARSWVCTASLAFLASCATTGGSIANPPDSGKTLFLGKILTMDDGMTVAEAVSVDERGHILKVGTEQDVREGLGAGAKVVQLEAGQVLMPGFIDPHLHLLPTLLQSVLESHNLAPCLPGPYRIPTATSCESRADVLSTLASIKLSPQAPKDEFVLGMNLDPSRQVFDPLQCGITAKEAAAAGNFMDNPKFYIERCVSKDRPVLILDQSGHLAYVNQRAIDVVCAGQTACPPSTVKAGGGEWAPNNTAPFTGLLKETSGYAPFMAAMQKSLPLAQLQTHPQELLAAYEKEIKPGIQAMRDAGLTTIADGGLVGMSQLNAVKFLAEQEHFPLRVTGVVTYDSAKAEGIQPTGPACDPRQDANCKLPKWLGAGGLKLWVDGSTQGCTAKLAAPYSYSTKGHCSDAGEGRADFENMQAIVTAMSAQWMTKAWRVQLHANGNDANQWAIDAFALLQQKAQNEHPVLFIHNTVGQEQLSKNLGDLIKGNYVAPNGQKAPAVKAHVTHLIGHVAYWGHAFRGMLGEAAANNLDPVGFDRDQGIPFSFHSDSMVTPPRPLWFVEQAVTRRTWAYPSLEERGTLGLEKHAATVEEALRAITIEPARQHELDGWVGSIEQGKVADFVVLGDNPLDYGPKKKDPTQIHKIPVVETYLSGQPTSKNP
ncbi:amidohydrolase family protein [Myxococcus landrumensis]|uniref:Amidohydrolase family protein n=1 Tax=Myxococcus landrumensis TaxID=2813577 RepID=A0ABX7N927_9BACT|nr:amidohydrolase family protein [Myxococcus landrumus]